MRTSCGKRHLEILFCGLMLEKKLKGLADIINNGDLTALEEFRETKLAVEI